MKNCKTCRNYSDGKCYSKEFEEHETVFPEIYLKIEKEDFQRGIEEDGVKLSEEQIDIVICNAKYHAEFEQEQVKKTGVIIKNPERFHCCDYR